jgi:DtxR family Mn-dependent transcriptional regulator
MLTQTEENYLKAIFHLSEEIPDKKDAGTNELALHLNVKPATVNDMLKKLKEKKLISYEKYGKITMTKAGRNRALEIVRKHRLWETFLCEKLGFSWDEVHEVAEQLEHIQSPKLIEQLDQFLGYPQFDPHGDSIPNAKGELTNMEKKLLADVPEGKWCKVVAIRDDSAQFLQYVAKVGLKMNLKLKVIARENFDGSIEIVVEEKHATVSQKFAENIYVV